MPAPSRIQRLDPSPRLSSPTLSERLGLMALGGLLLAGTASAGTGRLLATWMSLAPAIDGAFVLSTRGGDFALQLGTDVSIGYLSHDAENVHLYLQETLTFLAYTAEASVALTA